MKRSAPWLGNPLLEVLFILSPAILPVILVLVFKNYFITHEVTTWWWVLLVLCIDVSHVYSTLFRFYWDRKTFQSYKHLLLIIPAVSFIVALSLHYYSSLLFWRVLAYIAVFHFVRQQYGFMRLYGRKELKSRWCRLIDNISIYNATIYPLLFWHIRGTDKIAWFVKGDFITLKIESYLPIFTVVYLMIFFVYILKEVFLFINERSFNVPKNLIVAGTYLSWYFGIVAFQGDLIFTLLNVVSHGVPYMALIWIYGKQKTQSNFSFGMRGVLLFLGILFALAYFEENIWDSFIWDDHPEVFLPLVAAPIESSFLMSLLVSLLILPQVTHYVLDGFIWRLSKDAEPK
jgi:hypothetical protein